MKVRLVTYRDTMLATGVFSAGNHSTSSSSVTVTVTGVDATTIFSVGDRVYTGGGNEYGKLSAVNSATEIVFTSLNTYAITTGDQFYLPANNSFELDLQKEPNISINYQFDDVKNPDKTKGSFSQTFKLPFTNNNNKFFQEWYNVNLDTLVFDTKEEFDASIYVGTISQFDGVLQLKSVYQKAKYYEVVVFSKVSSLFSIIGDDSLRDAFKLDDNNFNESLNHTFNEAQMKNSWIGNTDDFENAAGVPLQDATANVQKVMYPISVTREGFYFNNTDNYLNMNQTELDTETNDTKVELTQFRPSIQVKEMIKIILAKAGLSYTSTFIDSTYFSKIFMTTGGHLEDSPVPIKSNTNTVVAPGQVICGYAETSSWGIMGTEGNPLTMAEQQQFDDCSENYQISYMLDPDTIIADDSGAYNTTNNFFRKEHPTQTLLTLKHRTEFKKFEKCTDETFAAGAFLKIELVRVKIDGSIFTNPFTGNQTIYATYDTEVGGGLIVDTWHKNWYEHNIDINSVPVGARFKIRVTAHDFFIQSPSNSDAGMSLGIDCTGNCGDNPGSDGDTCAGGYIPWGTASGQDCLSTMITMNYDGYDLVNYGATIDVPACIDPELKQKDFFKDLIQRFNLIVTTNPNNPSNIRIDTYDTYLGSGTIRYWTDKLDLSKETIVKDTSSLQKEKILFTDKEDEDLYNKEIKERHSWANVYGHLEITETNNKWAKGELKNNPMFSPYINGQILKSANSQQGYQTDDLWGTDLDNMAVQYEFSYQENDNEIEIITPKTNPKLFWYNGLPTDIKNDSGDAKTIFMHSYTSSGWTAHSFTNYPLCSPYELTPEASSDTATILPTTKSLYWDSWATPFVPDLTVFNWTQSTPSNWAYSLYGYYWDAYLQSLHHPESRLMDCYLNLNEVDIFNFDFNDEIFIKDSYWRILKIHNYQVGVKTSTKVTLIKVVDTLIGSECGFSVSSAGLVDDLWLQWCPNSDTDCSSPTVFVSPDCCNSRGGTSDSAYNAAAEANGFTNGELPCKAYQGSLPISKRMLSTKTNIRSLNRISTMGNKALISNINNFNVGSGKTKESLPIMTPIKDDISIKYKTIGGDSDIIPLTGESHRIVLIEQTLGNTPAYAYAQGYNKSPNLSLPNNSIVNIRINATNVVAGGTSATYPVGTMESFGYYTAFKMLNGTGTQIGAAGGVQEFGIADGTLRGSLAITLDTTVGQQNRVLFGLLNGQANTQRVWTLTVDFNIQIIPSLNAPLDTNWALWQDSANIQLQNRRSLLWN